MCIEEIIVMLTQWANSKNIKGDKWYGVSKIPVIREAHLKRPNIRSVTENVGGIPVHPFFIFTRTRCIKI